jgi:hypothetical protein
MLLQLALHLRNEVTVDCLVITIPFLSTLWLWAFSSSLCFQLNRPLLLDLVAMNLLDHSYLWYLVPNQIHVLVASIIVPIFRTRMCSSTMS